MKTTGCRGSCYNLVSPPEIIMPRLSLQHHEQPEQGATRCQSQKSCHLGQVAPLDGGELQQVSIRPPDQALHELDLERGERGTHDNNFRYKSVHWQALSTAPGEIPNHARNQGVATSGDKSRLQTILLEQSWDTVYKRLFLLSSMLNLIGLILAITGHFPYAKSRATLFSVANILAVVLARSEVFLRVLFWLAVRLLGHHWVPLRLKTTATAVLQCVGGIHSGCGVAALMWLVYALVEGFKHRQNSSDGMLGVACAILGLLSLSCFAAFPVVRHIHHNVFERLHRFAGWSSLGLVWAYIVLSVFWNPSTKSYEITAARRTRLAEMQTLWLLAATTVLVILPWLFVRKVTVKTVVPAGRRCSVLYFNGGVKPGLFTRISPSPFSEWHAFGIISDGREQYVVVAGAVGDFTKSLVDNPPMHIWVRRFHFAGLPYLASMYQKVLLVATGSGIGVFLSFLMQPMSTDVHVIWIARNIKESFGEHVWEVIRHTPSEKVTVIDSALSGRLGSKDLVVTKAKEWNAEVVIVTSNPVGSKEIVDGCRTVGVPAFGPIWDS